MPDLVQKGGHLILGAHFLLMGACQAHPSAVDLPNVHPWRGCMIWSQQVPDILLQACAPCFGVKPLKYCPWGGMAFRNLPKWLSFRGKRRLLTERAVIALLQQSHFTL